MKIKGALSFRHELSVLLVRITGARWAVAGADGQVTVGNLDEEEVIVTPPGSTLPLDGRPFQVRADLSEAWLDPLRQMARVLYSLHGGTALDSGISSTAAWWTRTW